MNLSNDGPSRRSEGDPDESDDLSNRVAPEPEATDESPVPPEEGRGTMLLGCLAIVAVAGGIAWLVATVFKSWWAVPASLGLWVVISIVVTRFPAEQRGKAGCLGFVLGLIAIGAAFGVWSSQQKPAPEPAPYSKDCPPGTLPEVDSVDLENKTYTYICVEQ